MSVYFLAQQQHILEVGKMYAKKGQNPDVRMNSKNTVKGCRRSENCKYMSDLVCER